VRGTWALAWTVVRARPRRAIGSAVGIAAAALVLGLALRVGIALDGGFDRTAKRADLPTLIVRFDRRRPADIERRIRALPNLDGAALRYEATDVPMRTRGHRTPRGAVQVVSPGRRGYAVVSGRDVRSDGREVVIERGLAREWGIGPGDRLRVGDLGRMRVVGVAVAPDNVAFPVATAARVYVSRDGLAARFGGSPGRVPVNEALVWARDPRRTDVLLTQARVAAAGLRDVRLLTRDGVRALLDRAAGLVVALLVVFSGVAVALSATLLWAGTRAELLRRLPAIGLQRALGWRPGGLAAQLAAQGVLVAGPAAALGLAVGALLAGSPTRGLLGLLNELEPSASATVATLVGAWLAVVALVALAAGIPAWRAARGSPAALLRGGDLAPGAGRGGRRGGLGTLGARLVAARRRRFAATVLALAAAASTVGLMLAMADLVERLRDDPTTLGRRYQLTARADPGARSAAAAVPGVAAVADRIALDAVSAGGTGTPLEVVAYRRDHTAFEAPPLLEGRRATGAREAEVGRGLADVLGLGVGSTLAVLLPSGREARFRVAGILGALQDDGRVAYVRTRALRAAGIESQGILAIRLDTGADRDEVSQALTAAGVPPTPTRAALSDRGGLVRAIAALLRLVAIAVGLVCAYALVQSLALVARERSSAIGTLRAVGAGTAALRRLALGASLAVAVPAALLGLALQAAVLAPLVAGLAAGYADLPLVLDARTAGVLLVALLVLAGGVGLVVGGRLARRPFGELMREDA
jgi:ABC-type antimicrobial peptide transport system permease subunit